MKKYAVELGENLGQLLVQVADKRGFTLTALVRFILWHYLDSEEKKKEGIARE